MMDPMIMATFLLLLRPLVALEGGGGAVALVFVVVGDAGGAVVRLDDAVERGMWVEETEEAVVFEVLFLGVVALAEGVDGTPDAVDPPSFCGLVHSTGFCPSWSTMLKSLLANVGGALLVVLRSETSK